MSKNQILQKIKSRITPSDKLRNVIGRPVNVISTEEIKNSPLLKAYFINSIDVEDGDNFIELEVFKVKLNPNSFYFAISSDYLVKNKLNIITTPVGLVALMDE